MTTVVPPTCGRSTCPFSDCLQARNGKRTIHYMGHVRMMEACAVPLRGDFQDGGTCREATAQEAEPTSKPGKGLQAIAIYRDTPKIPAAQHLEAVAKGWLRSGGRSGSAEAAGGRHSITHEICGGNQEGYITVGMYEDGRRENFPDHVEGGFDTFRRVDCSATISLSLQYGVRWRCW